VYWRVRSHRAVEIDEAVLDLIFRPVAPGRPRLLESSPAGPLQLLQITPASTPLTTWLTSWKIESVTIIPAE